MSKKNLNYNCIGIKIDEKISPLPKYKEGTYKGKINMKKLVGETLVFENIKTKDKYEIKIINYFMGDNTYFEVTYKNYPLVKIGCNSLVNNCNIKNIIKQIKQ